MEIPAHRLGNKEFAGRKVMQPELDSGGRLAIEKVVADIRKIEEDNNGIEQHGLDCQIGPAAQHPRDVHRAVGVAHPNSLLVAVLVEH